MGGRGKKRDRDKGAVEEGRKIVHVASATANFTGTRGERKAHMMHKKRKRPNGVI